MRLENKVAIVTGAGAGIGEAIAHKFAREGARLLLAGLPSDPVRDVADAITSIGSDADAEVYLGDLAEETEARIALNRPSDVLVKARDGWRHGTARPPRHSGRDGEYFRVSGFGRGELCHGSIVVSRWRRTPAKGSPGTAVRRELRRPPSGTLPTHHSHDGLKNKDVYRAPR